MQFLIDAKQDLFLGLPILLLLRFAIISILAIVLRRYIAAIVTQLFFAVFRKIAHQAQIQKFKELLQGPIQAVLMCILLFIALNQFHLYFEKIMLFERHKSFAHTGIADARSSSFSLMELIDHLFFFGLIFYIILLLARIIMFLFYIWVERAVAAKDRERQQLLPLLRDVLVVMVWSIGFFTVLGVVFHVNVATLIAGLGFGGVAIAFAAKESLENLLASFMIMVDKPFTIGDHIKIGSVEGRAEQIGFRSTRIRTFDLTLVSLPNKNLIGTNLENFSDRGRARVKLKLNAHYGLSESALKLVIQELKNTLENNENTVGDVVVFLENFGATIEISVSYYIPLPSVKTMEEIKQELNLEMYKIMYQYAQGFGFPAQVSINTEGKNEMDISE